MADEDKDSAKSKPTMPSAKDILKELRLNTPMGMSGQGIPKPMILGTMPKPTYQYGPPNFRIDDVKQALKDLDIPIKAVYKSKANDSYYMKYDIPGNPTKPGEPLPSIRFSSPGLSGGNWHAGQPETRTNAESAPLNFIDTAGIHKGPLMDTNNSGTFIRNSQGDYYNTLDAVRNAVIYRTGIGLVPPGTEPRPLNKAPPNTPPKLPPDPRQMDFMHSLLQGQGKPNAVLGGNKENLWHSGQMGQRFNLDTPKDFGVGSMYAMPMPANKEAPLLPGSLPANAQGPRLVSPGMQGTADKSYFDLLKALKDMKGTDPDAGQ